MYLVGSIILHQGREWLVLGIHEHAATIRPVGEGGPYQSLSLPAAWRAYDAYSATLAPGAHRLPAVRRMGRHYRPPLQDCH